METVAGTEAKNRLFLQVDYESEEGENSGDEDQEEVTEQPEEGVASDEANEERQGSMNSQASVPENVDGDTQDSMRVNKVLQLSSSIEAYRYDEQKGLWCEVQSCSLPAIFLGVSVLMNDIISSRSGRPRTQI